MCCDFPVAHSAEVMWSDGVGCSSVRDMKILSLVMVASMGSGSWLRARFHASSACVRRSVFMSML